MWAYISDYIRIKVLYDHGGLYLDTDVQALKPLDDFLDETAFVGIESSSAEGHGDFVAASNLGAVKGNPVFKEVLDFYADEGDHTIWNTKIWTLPHILKYALEKCYGPQKYPAKSKQEIIRYPDITLYPERYFIPFRWNTEFTPDCIEPDTHTIHWYGQSSWTGDVLTLNFLGNKHDPEWVRKHSNTLRKNYKLFGAPVLRTEHRGNRKTVKLFGMPLWATIQRGRSRVWRLFGLVTVLKEKY